MGLQRSLSYGRWSQGPRFAARRSFAAALAVYLVSAYLSAISRDQLVRDLLHRLRLRICGKLIHAPLRLIEDQDAGKIFTLIGHESERLASVAKDFIVTFQAGIVLVVALVYLTWLSPPSFAFATITIAIGAATYYWHENKAKMRYRQAREKEVEYFDTMYDLLHGFRDLKLDRRQQGEIMTHLETVSAEFGSLSAASAKLYQISELVSQAFSFILIAVIVFLLPLIFPASAGSTYQLLATVLHFGAGAGRADDFLGAGLRKAVALGNITRLEDARGRGRARNRLAGRAHRSIRRNASISNRFA